MTYNVTGKNFLWGRGYSSEGKKAIPGCGKKPFASSQEFIGTKEVNGHGTSLRNQEPTCGDQKESTADRRKARFWRVPGYHVSSEEKEEEKRIPSSQIHTDISDGSQRKMATFPGGFLVESGGRRPSRLF